MILFIFGLFSKNQFVKRNRWLTLGFFVFSVYLIFSWWCWWYGGSFGSRPMIDFYPLYAIFITACISGIMKMSLWIRRSLLSVIILLIGLNLFQTYQFDRRVIHHDAMTGKAYWKVFGKTERPKNFNDLLVFPEYQDAKRGNR
jgi:hypothetical protein